MDANTWLQSAPAVALIDHYLHSQQLGLSAQRSAENDTAIQRRIDAMPNEMRNAKRANVEGCEAEVERLRAQVAELTAGALVRAHRQCIAVEALTALSRMAMDEQVRQIARRAVAQIEEVTK